MWKSNEIHNNQIVDGAAVRCSSCSHGNNVRICMRNVCKDFMTFWKSLASFAPLSSLSELSEWVEHETKCFFFPRYHKKSRFDHSHWHILARRECARVRLIRKRQRQKVSLSRERNEFYNRANWSISPILIAFSRLIPLSAGNSEVFSSLSSVVKFVVFDFRCSLMECVSGSSSEWSHRSEYSESLSLWAMLSGQMKNVYNQSSVEQTSYFSLRFHHILCSHAYLVNRCQYNKPDRVLRSKNTSSALLFYDLLLHCIIS